MKSKFAALPGWLAPAAGLAILVLAGVGILRTAGEAAAPPSPPRHVWVQKTLPLRFEPNLGQTDPLVSFVARGAGYQVCLKSAEAVLTLEEPETASSSRSRRLGGKQSAAPSGRPRPVQSAGRRSAQVRVQLAGANASPPLRAETALGGHSNYFLGDDPAQWLRNVPHYGRVRAEAVYPGIDLIYYGAQGRLEYDFRVAPGRDPAIIEILFEGVERLHIDDSGDLVLTTSAGELRQHRPAIYQEIADEKRLIAGDYTLRGERRVGFRLAEYDRNLPLVIDPILTFSTYLGGSLFDEMEGVALDPQGRIYVSGATSSANFPAPSPRRPRSGPSDAVVLKLDSQGTTVLYSTFLGGSSSEDFFNVLAVDGSGNAYVSGFTDSTDFPTMQPIQAAPRGGPGDVFASKLDANGNLVYSTYLGGNGDDWTEGVAVDAAGAFYLAGNTDSTNFPTQNARQGTFGGDLDGFVAKINPAGSALVYSTYVGGNGVDFCNDVAVDSGGSAYVTGSTDSGNFPTTPGAYRQTGDGSEDAFLAKLNPSGSAFTYSTRLGGSGDDSAISVAVDSAGSAYVGGSTESTDFPVMSIQAANAGERDVFVTKFSPSGAALVHSTYLGGNEVDFLNQIKVNRFGEAYVAGLTLSANFPTVRAVQPAFGGFQDAFLSKLNSSGSALAHSTFLGGSDEDLAIGLALDGSGAAVLVGFTVSPDFPAVNALQPAPGGVPDGFLARIDEVVNVSAASYQGAEIAAASIAAAFAPEMAAETKEATNVPLPTSLADASISVTDSAGTERPGQLFVVTPGQINFFIPEGTALGPATVAVTTADGDILRQTVQIVAAAPGIFSANASGSGPAAALVLRVKPDGSQSFETAAVFDAQQGAFVANPIDLGPEGDQIYLIMYGTGLRGAPSATATVGGVDVTVAGPAPHSVFVGLDQANLGPIPATLAGRGDVEIVFQVSGKTANTVTVQFR